MPKVAMGSMMSSCLLDDALADESTTAELFHQAEVAEMVVMVNHHVDVTIVFEAVCCTGSCGRQCCIDGLEGEDTGRRMKMMFGVDAGRTGGENSIWC